MKIYKKLDDCVSTPALRRNWLAVILCLLLLWQMLWLLLPALRLIGLYTYDQLFDFYSNLSAYQSSWIVNLIMALAADASVTLSGIGKALLSSWSLSMTWIAVLSLLVFLSGCSKRKLVFALGALVLLLGAACTAAALCLQASAISYVLYIIRLLGWFLILFVCVCAGLVLKEVIIKTAQIQAEIDQI